MVHNWKPSAIEKWAPQHQVCSIRYKHPLNVISKITTAREDLQAAKSVGHPITRKEQK